MFHQRFEDFLESYESALKTLDLGYIVRMTTLCRAGIIIKLHEDKGLTLFDNDIIAGYLQDAEQRLYEGELKKKQYDKIWLDVERLLEFRESGVVTRAVNSLLKVLASRLSLSSSV